MAGLMIPLTVLLLTAAGVASAGGRAGRTTNNGDQGLSEVLVTFVSNFDNNGLSFGGLSSNSAFYNLTTVVAMVAGRFALGVLAPWLAGIFVGQRRKQPNSRLPDRRMWPTMTKSGGRRPNDRQD